MDIEAAVRSPGARAQGSRLEIFRTLPREIARGEIDRRETEEVGRSGRPARRAGRAGHA